MPDVNCGNLNLALEPLEQRRHLAGSVTATLTSGGDLVIEGDSDSNEILLTRNQYGAFDIAGVNGTTVNGVSRAIFSSFPADDIRINLRDGDNRLRISGSSNSEQFLVPDQLTIITGNGSDVVALHNVLVIGTTRIRTGNGDDAVGGFGGHFYKMVNINTGAGDDLFYTMTNDSTAPGRYTRMTLNMGAGNDGATIQVNYFDRLTMRLGSGDDQVDSRAGTALADAFVISGQGGNDIYYGREDTLPRLTSASFASHDDSTVYAAFEVLHDAIFDVQYGGDFG